ncbi:ABC transporter substrate-binding protein [uncultured Ilyobacter sp.]|uniref:ABC transporter substrate-binding protein n=1 Tax=uncultured Ilyobacter sp. TaxID=544433 RepID=UPI0029C7A88D|nr:ABC transporter substrate-binding protein [uncultured Ilyobacter sp.]
MKFKVMLIWMFITINIFAYEVMEGDKPRKLAKSYERIISVYPAHTEVILDIGGKSKLVGTVKEKGVSERTQGIKNFSYNDSLEKYLSVRPDLVIIRPMYRDKNKNLFKRLEDMGVTVVSLQPVNYNDLERYWIDIGNLIGREKAGREYVARYRKGLESIGAKSGKRKKVFFEARMQNGLYTASKESIAHFIIEKAGGDIVTGNDEPLRKGTSTLTPVNMEYLISQGSSIDTYLVQKGKMNSRSRDDIKKTPGYASIKAVKTGEIYLIDESTLSRPTIKILDAMKDIKKILSK